MTPKLRNRDGPLRCPHDVSKPSSHNADSKRKTARRLAKTGRDTGLAFTSKTGAPLDAANVRRALRRVAELAGLDPTQWAPRELRHSFVSLLSDSGMRLEDIADLCGHAGTTVTGKVYRHQLRPVSIPPAR